VRIQRQSDDDPVDVSESAYRDVTSLGDWSMSVGIETCDGFVLVASGGDDDDDVNVNDNRVNICAATCIDIPTGAPVLYVPHDSMMTGTRARMEIEGDCGPAILRRAESILLARDDDDDVWGEVEAGDATTALLLQFHLFLKIVREYELGRSSPWHTYLDSLPWIRF
jgi:hypothetical protein